MEDRQKIKEFFEKHMLCTISTVSRMGAPESATVAFSQTNDLELIFGTFATTRKFKNLESNRRVAFVISSGEESVQYEGEARLVEGAELEEVRNIHLLKNPASKKYAFDPEQRFFRVTPHWLRYTNLDKKPEEVFEIDF